jgi:hypothetical protein
VFYAEDMNVSLSTRREAKRIQNKVEEAKTLLEEAQEPSELTVFLGSIALTQEQITDSELKASGLYAAPGKLMYLANKEG